MHDLAPTAPPQPDVPDPSSSTPRSLAEEISPDDWRLYHLMRELPNEDRARVIAFAELLFTLRQACAAVQQRSS